MSRLRRKIGARKSIIAFVVEGKTEMWYLQMLKKNEERQHNVRINIKPEIPQKRNSKNNMNWCVIWQKSIRLFFWILDFDVVLKETSEHRKGGKRPLDEFLEYRERLQKKKYDNVRVVVNNPCFEYWFLLHYVRTQRRYRNCSGVIRELEKKLHGYEKTEKYFKNKNKDIYSRLKPHLKEAIDNATAFGSFDFGEPKKAMCEMDELFVIEELRHCGE